MILDRVPCRHRGKLGGQIYKSLIFPILIRSLAAISIRIRPNTEAALMLHSPRGLPKSRCCARQNSPRSQFGFVLFRRGRSIAADLHDCQRYSYRCVALGEPAMSKDSLATPVAVPPANIFVPQTRYWIEFAGHFCCVSPCHGRRSALKLRSQLRNHPCHPDSRCSLRSPTNHRDRLATGVRMGWEMPPRD